MPDHTAIYTKKAEQYDILISRQKSVYQTLEKIKPFEGLDIIDMGAGTGRLTCLLAPKAKSILAFDISQAMLDVTASKLKEKGLNNWRTQVADHRQLPVEDNSADLIVSGWSICYLGSSNVPNWKQNIHQIMEEIKRVLRPGGSVIIFETMGTGTVLPNPPDFLKSYYSLLENGYGFSNTIIRTDYTFENLAEAEELTRFFFGNELADKVAEQGLVQLPEWAGVWWREF
ncbi:class I SAM-dependent methyltransferase [Thermoflavimicrobium dichotomicum]|uniref:Methyltransferase domain-containing protein n=1 Tax=Thermoflavimicrobium dichotomicum TaxID=46223 RepID=A0A1I3P8J2_9BACL|nr:class I SAM-dependent methyltransferase [Thermoflavimicrobium dichotomicum]SFJ17660.1 Methyltransferase domain-containing protein [Thermoflavimicrobium dichotomicum]